MSSPKTDLDDSVQILEDQNKSTVSVSERIAQFENLEGRTSTPEEKSKTQVSVSQPTTSVVYNFTKSPEYPIQSTSSQVPSSEPLHLSQFQSSISLHESFSDSEYSDSDSENIAEKFPWRFLSSIALNSVTLFSDTMTNGGDEDKKGECS